MKNIILFIKDEQIKPYSHFKKCCIEEKLPYWKLTKEKFPIFINNCKIEKHKVL